MAATSSQWTDCGALMYSRHSWSCTPVSVVTVHLDLWYVVLYSCSLQMSCTQLHHDKTHITPEDVEEYTEGNLCRCTGYRPIIEAGVKLCSSKSYVQHVYNITVVLECCLRSLLSWYHHLTRHCWSVMALLSGVLLHHCRHCVVYCMHLLEPGLCAEVLSSL